MMTSSIRQKGSREWPKPSRLGATDRLMAIAPLLEQKQRERGLVGKIAREHSVSRITIWRWRSKFKAGGYAALVRTRSDRGCLRYICSHPEIALMIESRMSRGRAAFSIWKSLCLVLGASAPGYHIVLGYVKRQREAGRSSPRRETKGMSA
jgi:hypothetical protein